MGNSEKRCRFFEKYSNSFKKCEKVITLYAIKILKNYIEILKNYVKNSEKNIHQGWLSDVNVLVMVCLIYRKKKWYTDVWLNYLCNKCKYIIILCTKYITKTCNKIIIFISGYQETH